MNRPECSHAMTNELASCERCGTPLVVSQPKPQAVSANPFRIDPQGQPQGCTAAPSITQTIPVTMAFPGMREPIGQPVVSAPAPNAPRSIMNAPVGAPVKIDRLQRGSRKARTVLVAGLVSVLLLGFGGGMTAFAFEDSESRMPTVVEYEETVAPDVSTASPMENGTDVVTIEDDLTPMASSPTSQSSVADFAVDVEPAPVTDAAPSPLAGALEQAPTEAAPEPLAPYTLEINGTRVPYIHSVFATLCPDNNAALWAGSDDTTDGSYGYFIGHNPGDFACVYALVPGNYVTLCDANGNLRNYTVNQLYDIPNTTIFQDLLRDVIPQGESLIMQTCIDDGSYYRIVVCQ